MLTVSATKRRLSFTSALKVIGLTNLELRISNYQLKVHYFFSNLIIVLIFPNLSAESCPIVCYMPYTNGEKNKFYILKIKWILYVLKSKKYYYLLHPATK